MDWAKTTARRDGKRLSLGIWVRLVRALTVLYVYLCVGDIFIAGAKVLLNAIKMQALYVMREVFWILEFAAGYRNLKVK